MINDNILIKFERARGHKYDWPEIVIQMKERMKEMKLGFPGIGNDHMSLVPFSQIKEGSAKFNLTHALTDYPMQCLLKYHYKRR